jgi:hypothetical protein
MKQLLNADEYRKQQCVIVPQVNMCLGPPLFFLTTENVTYSQKLFSSKIQVRISSENAQKVNRDTIHRKAMNFLINRQYIPVANAGIFQRGEGGASFPPLRLVFRGVGVSTTNFDFLRGVPLSKCVIVTQFLQCFLTKGDGGFLPMEHPPLWIR